MAEIVKTPLHTAYHVLGYQVPTVLAQMFVKAPIALFERVVGMNEGILREGDWVMVAARYDASKRRADVATSGEAAPGLAEGALVTRRHKDDISFSSLDFFGFGYNKDPVLREQWFSNERYPYPRYGGHFHTIMGNFRREFSYARMGYQREEVASGFDGCKLYLEWCLCDAKRFPDGPKGVVAVVPGLTSTCQSTYIQRFVRQCVRNGYHVVVLETRGVAHPLTMGRTTCATFTQDIEYLFSDHLTEAYMGKRFGNKDLKVMAVGFSMGGTQLCHMLGKAREASRLHCAMAVCSPFDFHHSVSVMHRPFPMMTYQPALTRGLVRMTIKEAAVLSSAPTTNAILRRNVEGLVNGTITCRTTSEFDALVTCPCHGYANTTDYFNAASSFDTLHKIEVPVLCFTALDDPIVGAPPALRRWDFTADANPNLLYVRVPTGGHLGFMRGPIDELLGRPSYLEERLVRALDAAVAQPTKVPVRRDVPDVLEVFHHSSSSY